MNNKEEFKSGVAVVEIQINNWIFVFGLRSAILRAKDSLDELAAGGAPYIDGMISEYMDFLNRHNAIVSPRTGKKML